MNNNNYNMFTKNILKRRIALSSHHHNNNNYVHNALVILWKGRANIATTSTFSSSYRHHSYVDQKKSRMMYSILAQTNKASCHNNNYNHDFPKLFTTTSYTKSHNNNNNNIYDVDETNKSISQIEQERIKIELSVHTGTNDQYQNFINELQNEQDVLDRMLLKTNEYEFHNDSDDEAIKQNKMLMIVKQMQKVALLLWNLGSLDDLFTLQKDILQRQIQFYSDVHKSQDTNNGNDDDSSSSSIPQHIDIASTLHFIGSIQCRLNQLNDAKKWFDASLKMKKHVLCDTLGYEHHYEIGKTYNGLAIVALQTYDTNDDDHNNGYSQGMNNNTSLVDIIRLFELAEANYVHHGERKNDNDANTPIDMEDGYIGDSMADHPNIASINENMAMLYRKHGDFAMALQKYNAALRIRMFWISTDQLETFGDAQVVNLKMDKGDCLKALERYEEALEEYEEALRLHLLVIRRMRQQQTDGERYISPMEGVLRHNIGNMHAHSGRHQLAMEEYQSSLKIKKEIDKHSPEVALTLNAIGALKATLGQHSTALAYFNEALYVLRYGMSGENDIQIIETKKNIEIVEKQRRGNFSGGLKE